MSGITGQREPHGVVAADIERGDPWQPEWEQQLGARSRIYACFTPEEFGGVICGDWDHVRALHSALRAKGFDPVGPGSAGWSAGVAQARVWLLDHRHADYARRQVRVV